MRITVQIEAEDAALAGVGPRLQALVDSVEAAGGIVPVIEKVAADVIAGLAGGGAGAGPDEDEDAPPPG